MVYYRMVYQIICPGNAYKSISFEREANKFDNDDTYLTNRKAFAWFKFMKK